MDSEEEEEEEEEESTEPKSPLSPLSSDVEKSDDRGESSCPPPDLTCTRSQSASACEPTSKVRYRFKRRYFVFYVSALNSSSSLCAGTGGTGDSIALLFLLVP